METSEPLREFRTAEVLRYPGPKRGANMVSQGLGTYMESVPGNDGSGSGRNLMHLDFSVLRHVSWDKRTLTLTPFMYSVSIGAFHPLIPPQALPIPGSAPTISFFAVEQSREHFSETASGLEGFVVVGSGHSLDLYFRNGERKLGIRWGVYLDQGPTIGVHVTQDEPVGSLDAAVWRILPRAVSVFNRLELTKQLSDQVVAEVIKRAYEGDKIMPECRVKRA